ncbi:MAG: C40 family peptidase [Oscillospiraceae bacterium]|nr:C40 family peptidase [Oscillospiraceae bacterium]
MKQRKNSRLQFTDAERGEPKLKEHIRRADKAADKAEAAQKKIPKRKKPVKQSAVDPATGKVKTRLRFEEVEKPAPTAKLSHAVKAAPANTVAVQVHRKIQETEQDNVGVERAHKLEETAEGSARLAAHSYRTQKLRPYREAAKAKMKMEKANVNALFQKHIQDNPQLASNPISRWQQKRAIKKQYAASVRSGESVTATMENAAKAAKHAAEKSKNISQFFWKHKKEIGIVIALFLTVAVLLNVMASCSVLVEGIMSGLSSSMFPSQDDVVLSAEAAYAGMEAALQSKLDNYESTHNYDEYHYDLDEIKHDPYVLTAILTAYHRGGWTLEQVQGTLEMLFDRQYTLTETVTTETRYDSENEPYQYSICTVKLDNFDLSHLPVYLLDEEGMNIYAVYIATLGNRPDLFPTSEYPNASQREDYLDYDVPLEALEDEVFARMLAEAEKYLGYPYVWGGSSPATSFDCSGFVSWVINHSGWNVGRRGAQGLCNLCTPVSPSNARPGDLVFFKGTYDTPGVSHCGIYVGNGMMIHCGSPISYANLNTRYWQQHFYCYGRLP